MPETVSERAVTVNQIVAWNMAFYRRAASLSQEELGRRMGGMSGTAVSAAERSWDGTRRRDFDAHELLSLSRALRVPVLALLLPPDDPDDGTALVAEMPGGERLDMGAYFEAIMPDSDDQTPAMDRYRTRLTEASVRYQDAGWGEGVQRMLTALTAPEQRAAKLNRIAYLQDALRDAGALLGEIGDIIRDEP
jgi:hypothetical protein